MVLSLFWHTLTNHHLLRTTLATWSAQFSCHCSRAPCTLATGRKYEESTAPTSRLGKRASDESLCWSVSTLLLVCLVCTGSSPGRKASSDSRGTLWLANSPLTQSGRYTPGSSCCRTCTCSSRPLSPGSGLVGCRICGKLDENFSLASSPVSLAATGERWAADIPAADESGDGAEHGVGAEALVDHPFLLSGVRP